MQQNVFKHIACDANSGLYSLRQVTWKRWKEVHPLTIGLYPFAPDTRIGVDYNQRMNEWSLIIQDIRPTDEGVYQCQISTKNDHESYNIWLHVRST